MARLRSRYLTCFYCGKRSDTRFDGVTRQFTCKYCDAANHLDEVRMGDVLLIKEPRPSDMSTERRDYGPSCRHRARSCDPDRRLLLLAATTRPRCRPPVHLLRHMPQEPAPVRRLACAVPAGRRRRRCQAGPRLLPLPPRAGEALPTGLRHLRGRGRRRHPARRVHGQDGPPAQDDGDEPAARAQRVQEENAAGLVARGGPGGVVGRAGPADDLALEACGRVAWPER